MAFVSREKFPILLAGGIFLLIGIVVAGISLFLWNQNRAEERGLQTHGQAVSGTVLRKTIQADRSSEDGGTSYRIGYRFAPPQGQEIAGSAPIEPAFWYELQPGTEIEVVYMPEAPRIHRVEGQEGDGPGVIVVGAVGTILILVGGWMVGLALRRAPAPVWRGPGIATAAMAFFGRSPILFIGWIVVIVGLPIAFAGVYQVIAQRAEDARFAAEAEAAEGIVLTKDVVQKSSGSSSNRSSTTYYRVSYRYLSPYGEEIVGTSDLDSGAWDRLREREPIVINYLPESPWLHRVEGDSGRWARPLTLLAIGLGICLIGGVCLAIGAGDLRALRGLPSIPRRTSAATTHLGAAHPPVQGLPEGGSLARGILRVAGSGRHLFGLSPRLAVPIIGAVFLVVGPAAILMSLGDLRDERRFATSGLIVEARVVAKTLERAKRDENSSTDYVALYRFAAPNGQVFEGRYVLPADEWESLKENDAVQVRYLPDEPWRHRPANEDRLASAVGGLGMGLLFASIGGVIVAILVWRTLRRRRLLRTGVGAEAVVVAVEPSWLKVNHERQCQVRYRFRDAAGKEHEGTSGPLPPDEAERWQPGDTGAVRYDPARPQDSLWTGEAAGR